MADLTKIENTDLIPFEAGPSAATLVKWVPENFEAERTLIYGGRAPVGASPGHNHAADGGEVLADRPVLSLTLGPTFNSGGAGGENTVPREGVYMPPYETGVDADTERPLAFAPCLIPGGVSSLSVKVLVYSGTGTDTIAVKVSLRDYSAHGQDFGAGTSEVTGSASVVGDFDTYHVLTIELDDLTPLGDPTLDREVEFCLWQAFSGDVNTASTYRAIHVVATASSTTVGRTAKAADVPLAQVTVGDIKAKAPVSSDLSGRIRLRYNQTNQALWGRSPGLQQDAKTPDRRRPLTQLIEAEHSHEGAVFPVTGEEFESRGAIIREQYAVRTWSTTGLTSGQVNQQRGAQVNPRGLLVGFPAGTGEDTQAVLHFTIPVAAGLGALLLRFAGFTTDSDANTELVTRVDVADEAGTSIVSAVGSGLYQPNNVADGNGFYATAVDPLDNGYYQSNKARRTAGLGLWTQDALLPGLAQPPSKYTISNNVSQTFNRVSELVRIDLTYPPQRSGDDFRKTQDFRVKVKFELSLLDSGGYGDFFLLFCHLFPAPGY